MMTPALNPLKTKDTVKQHDLYIMMDVFEGGSLKDYIKQMGKKGERIPLRTLKLILK